MPGELFTTRDVEAGALQIRALLEQAKREAERVNQAPIEPVYYANPLDALKGASLEDLSLPPQERCAANNTIFNEGNSVPGAAASSLDFVGRQMAETQILKAAEKRNQGDEVEETMRASKVSSPTLLSWLQQYLARTPNTLSDEQAAKVAQGCVEDKHSFLMRR